MLTQTNYGGNLTTKMLIKYPLRNYVGHRQFPTMMSKEKAEKQLLQVIKTITKDLAEIKNNKNHSAALSSLANCLSSLNNTLDQLVAN